jgi:multidrug efflux system outer membrane protein
MKTSISTRRLPGRARPDSLTDAHKSKAAEYAALQTVREYEDVRELAKPLDCAAFPRFGSSEAVAVTRRTPTGLFPRRLHPFAETAHGSRSSFTKVILLSGLLAGCAVGPDYKRPTVNAPQSYKESNPGTWKESNPSDQIAKGTWWELFGDPVLNRLETEATTNNQALQAAVARVTEARATARVAKAEFFPAIELAPEATRSRYSPNLANPLPKNNASQYLVPLDFSYEVDLWGRVRRSFEAARAEATASVASYETILLTLKADVAVDYFTLRSLDSEIAILRRTIDLRKEELALIQARFKGGAANDLDVSRAETELATSESDYAGVQKQRAELEHALAVLLGRNAADFTLAESPLDLAPPEIPAGMPSELLERRPDVAEAERFMAAQNARIGIAKAAFFPVVRLTGAAGLQSGDITTLFNWESRAWSFGPSITFPIFEGGRNKANLAHAKAAYEETVAQYRQQVLVAFGEVENGLSGLRILASQSDAQARAVASATRTSEISSRRYQAGLVSYLEVVDSDRTKLQSEREASRLQGQQLVVSVQLIKALGGGWQDSTATKMSALRK